jgi:hypothetical protein
MARPKLAGAALIYAGTPWIAIAQRPQRCLESTAWG